MQNVMTSSRPRGNDRRPLLAAGVLGLVAAILVMVLLSGSDKARQRPADEPLVQVVTASTNIKAGQKLTSDMFSIKSLPVSAVPASSLKSVDQAVGQTTRYPVQAGSQLTSDILVAPAKVSTLSFQIPPGLRAMTIPVSNTDSPSSLTAPGDFVDVLVRSKAAVLGLPVSAAQVGLGRNPSDVEAVVMLLQNVQVLSVDRGIVPNGVPYDSSVRGTPPDAKDNVSFLTLALTPDQAQLLWLAQDGGKLGIILRPFGDDERPGIQPRVEPVRP
jgi:pilus assembly protein CpaB